MRSTPALSLEGSFWSFDALVVAPRPAQGDRVPIWIGGSSNAALRIASARGAGLLTAGFAPAQIQELRDRVGPDLPLGVLVWFADGMITAQGETRDANAMAAAYEEAGTDLLVAVLAAGSGPATVITGMEHLIRAARR